MSVQLNRNQTYESSKTSVLVLPMHDEPWQRDKLNTVFSVGHNLKLQLTADRKKALEQMVRTKEWRAIQEGIRSLFRQFEENHPEREQKSNPEKYEAAAKELEKALEPLYAHRKAMAVSYGFSRGAFQKRINKYAGHFKRTKKSYIVPAPATQKIADAVWAKFSAYLYGNGAEIHFPKWSDFKYIECKENRTGITFVKMEDRYWESYVIFNGMRISLNIDPPNKDVYGYQQTALEHNALYCGISRRWYPEGWRYFLHLVLDGPPPVKRHWTGELLHPMGKGRVGHDIGTQTLASCGDKNLTLVELADKVKGIDAQLRRLNRAMDRSRRATNTEMFAANGEVIPIDKLPSNLLTKFGKRKWVKSRHYCRLESERRSLYREQREMRVRQHNELCNKLLAYGDEHYIETMNFKALAKRAKETKKNAKGKNLSKKRFGRSISNKAPAMFVNILEKKVIAAGGTFSRINTTKARASQYNHATCEYKKKGLSKRWDKVGGHDVQRDMYSSYLIKNTNNTLDGFLQEECEAGFENFLALHAKEINRIKDVCMPGSAGLAHFQ